MEELSYEKLLKRYRFVLNRNKELEEKIEELNQELYDRDGVEWSVLIVVKR